MINQQTHALLDKFKEIPALAYHLSQRESFDLDICFPFSDKLPELDFLESFEELIPLEFEQGIIDTAINEGGDINEVMKRYIINGIKVDFVINPSSNIYESEILKSYLLSVLYSIYP